MSEDQKQDKLDEALVDKDLSVPETLEARTKELIELIHRIRRSKLMNIEELIKFQDTIMDKLDEIEKKAADVTNEVMDGKLGAKEGATLAQLLDKQIKNLIAKKALLQEKRHLVKFLAIEESRLKAKLLRIERNIETEE